ncbi:hypothetical protein [Nostoc sp. UHCC 0251]|uniref:hypothetical protein n=1 Tax=Nostoc sp. UHCC 0251 TaxID=3110240 RepID=UPI002B1FA9B8|nr:hypothetical protein [Nostoc sp. UHCC 0251]MEA5626880.1 hypothetical protein [Nostoc sp. UHCC 0251]
MTEAERQANIYLQKHLGVQAGDVIRLSKPWSTLKAGEIGIIGGLRHQVIDAESIVFRNYSAFRDEQLVSCSGGPGTIRTDTKLLIPTGEKMLIWFWRWKDGRSGRDQGERYKAIVNVWEWDGSN